MAFFVDLARSQGSDPAGTLRLAPQARALATSLVGLLSPAAGERPSPEVDRRRAALAFMRAHLADPERIAAAVHLSKRSLFRLFEETDTTVMGQLRSLRLEHARTMLRTHPGRPISVIAAGAGFSGPVPFHRAFRETEGMTPGEYRDLVAGRVEPRAVSADADG